MKATAGTALRIEFLWSPEIFSGPGMAICDLLLMMASLATLRAEACRISWQWTDSAGQPAPRHLPSNGRRSARPDIVVVPGWHARNGPHLDTLVRRNRAACDRLLAVHARGGQVLGIYTGVALLGAAGLLRNRSAAVPWPFVGVLQRHAPQLRLAQGEAWVGQDGVWSCDSPALATDAMLAVLRNTAAQSLADSAGAVLLHSRERQQLAGRIAAATGSRRSGPGTLERARRFLEDQLELPYNLAAVARAAATSPRSLLRHFRAAHGTTPLGYLHRLRVTRAKMMLETTYLNVEAITIACGYRDMAMFRRVFVQATGLNPSAYREQFRLRDRRREWGRDLVD